ncbi:g12746 [Coccomyxa viridis]|uniref:G12746 protein n=1 Tax=Coccomyxa viridis TaxID=1274662 RepID=A0ABP1GB51_9CHLO
MECSNGCGHGSHQATLNAVKVEDSPQISGPGQGALGEVMADPESQQPAQDRAQALRSKPAAALGCTPGRAAAAAGKGKRSRSQAEDAPPKPSAKRSKTTKPFTDIQSSEEISKAAQQQQSSGN